MKTAALCAVFLFLLLTPAAATPVDSVGTIGYRLDDGSVNEVCSAWAVRPLLIITASHCVGYVGNEQAVTHYRGSARVHILGTVVWDGVRIPGRLDIAFVAIESPWPYPLKLARFVPKKGEQVELISWWMGLRRWTSTGIAEGLFDMEGIGWVFLYRSTGSGTGASGSPVLKNGRVVGLHIASVPDTDLRVSVPVGVIAWALREYDRNGPMVPEE